MEAAKGQVLVVGSVNVDLVVRVDRLPVPGQTVTGGTLERHHGGKGANQAVAAARLGAGVRFVGAVGRDDLGAAAVAALDAEGVEVSGVQELSGHSTGVAVIVVDGAGENQIAVVPGANAAVDAALVERALRGVEVGAGGVLLTNLELPDDAILGAARAAAGAGMRIVVNPAPARVLPGELLALRPLLVPNEGEAAFLGGADDPGEAGGRLYARTGAPVVVTLGARGALLVTEDGPRLIAGVAVEVVDTTGAGDTICGVLAAELARGAPLEDAVPRAVAAAALSVTRRGARGGMPTAGELTGFLEELARR